MSPISATLTSLVLSRTEASTAFLNLVQFSQIVDFAFVSPSPEPLGNIASVILLFLFIECA